MAVALRHTSTVSLPELLRLTPFLAYLYHTHVSYLHLTLMVDLLTPIFSGRVLIRLRLRDCPGRTVVL